MYAGCDLDFANTSLWLMMDQDICHGNVNDVGGDAVQWTAGQKLQELAVSCLGGFGFQAFARMTVRGVASVTA